MAQDGQVELQVTSDRSGDGLRLLITHTEAVRYDVRTRDDRIDIVYGSPIRSRPGSKRFRGAPLERFDISNDRTLTLYLSQSYRQHQVFELRNPFRLVVDISGSPSGERPPTTSSPPAARRSGRIVVIDPGHGGREDGAVGPAGLREKDVALDLARRLRRVLQQDPTVSVVLTRDEDRLVGLDERTAIANHNRADLFLSIHLNSSPRANAKGAETYFLSNSATDEEARTLAALENRASGVEERVLGVDGEERRNLDLVLWDLAQNRFMAESSALAERVQTELNRLTGTRNRGVRQAPFRVLMGATMPAILVEVGFISNADEEDRFQSASYRNQVVEAISTAVLDFLHQLSRQPAPTPLGNSAP